jgi:hypothetical protein
MNLETKITIYKFTPQLFTLTHVFGLEKRIKKCFQKEKEKELQVSGFSGQRKAYLLIQNKHIPLHSPYFYR